MPFRFTAPQHRYNGVGPVHPLHIVRIEQRKSRHQSRNCLPAPNVPSNVLWGLRVNGSQEVCGTDRSTRLVACSASGDRSGASE